MEELPQTKFQKPEILKILCILTFIGSSLSMISNLALYAMLDEIKKIFADDPVYNFMGVEINMTIFLNVSPSFFLLSSILYSVSLAGAIRMWKLYKSGFHFYTISQILLLIIPKIFIPTMPFPIMDLILSGSFIYFYYQNLKYMH